MTDNGLAALAAALHDIHPGPRPWVGGLTAEEFAAAILGPRGVFLPDGLPRPTASVMQAYEDGVESQAATIAALRAALDGLVVAAEVACECYEGFRSDGTLAPLLTGTQIAALRAALATAKETP